MNTALQDYTISAIRQECQVAAEPLLRVAGRGVKAVHQFHFNIGKMRDFLHEDIRKSVEHREDFKRLAAVQRPVVYVFEICSPGSPAAAESYKGTRAVPARRQHIDVTSSVLYVGKVKKALWGRVIQHLGFSRTAATQGLQLHHWTRGMVLELQLTAYEFEDDMANLLPLVELAVARQLRPLLGKHE